MKKPSTKIKPLTKKRFEQLLKKAAQPVSEWQHDQEGKETLYAKKTSIPDNYKRFFSSFTSHGKKLERQVNDPDYIKDSDYQDFAILKDALLLGDQDGTTDC